MAVYKCAGDAVGRAEVRKAGSSAGLWWLQAPEKVRSEHMRAAPPMRAKSIVGITHESGNSPFLVSLRLQAMH